MRINVTRHNVVLRRIDGSGEVLLPSGDIARVCQLIGSFDARDIAAWSFEAVTGLPNPETGIIYVASAMVKEAAKAQGRIDVVSPATNHKDAVRDEKGQIVSVPGFIL